MTKWFPAALLVLSATVAVADDAIKPAQPTPKKPEKKAVETFTDPAKAGPDFAVQGEYVGTLPNSKDKIGVHVLADGDGKFTVRTYPGGLPGDGWTGDAKVPSFAMTTNDKGEVAGGPGRIKEGKLHIARDSNAAVVLERVERKSPTLGMKPPEGAVVLFGGPEDAKNWKNGKLSPDGLLTVAGTGNIYSRHASKDFTLHLEFRLPFMPRARGQGRANSGMYLQNRYECQILDSFALKGENNECGAFYQAAAPKPNMCFPPLAWQTYDVEFTAARFENGQKVKKAVVTVKHNGVVIHDKFELPGPSPASQKEEDTPGVLHLQDHGNPVVFRNIWVVDKK